MCYLYIYINCIYNLRIPQGYEFGSAMLSLRVVRNPKSFVTNALTYQQAAQIENEALWLEGNPDMIEEQEDNLTDAAEQLEAANYLDDPIIGYIIG